MTDQPVPDVFEKHPEAAPFADLIQGDTPEEVEAMAAEIAQRVRAAQVDVAVRAQATVAEALEKRDFAAFLRAKREQDGDEKTPEHQARITHS